MCILFYFLFLIFFLISTGTLGGVKKEQKSLPDAVGELNEKSVDDDFGIIFLKKHLFQDIFMEHQKNDKLQFGYVCENPMQWEQRFEEKDLAENRHRGKVKWGNIDGSYGEHYWDLNHK